MELDLEKHWASWSGQAAKVVDDCHMESTRFHSLWIFVRWFCWNLETKVIWFNQPCERVQHADTGKKITHMARKWLAQTGRRSWGSFYRSLDRSDLWELSWNYSNYRHWTRSLEHARRRSQFPINMMIHLLFWFPFQDRFFCLLPSVSTWIVAGSQAFLSINQKQQNQWCVTPMLFLSVCLTCSLSPTMSEKIEDIQATICCLKEKRLWPLTLSVNPWNKYKRKCICINCCFAHHETSL